MPANARVALELRKTPIYARPTLTVEALSEEIIQALLSHGAERLTNARVAADVGAAAVGESP